MDRPSIPLAVEHRVRAAARHRCGYCLSPQYLVMARLEIEHIVPLAKDGANDESTFGWRAPCVTGTRVTGYRRPIRLRAQLFRSSIRVPRSGASTSVGPTMACVSRA